MGSRSFGSISMVVLGLVGGWLRSQALLPEVQERKLSNGVRVLLVERPGTGSLHAAVFLQGGRMDTGALPSVAAELLARCLAKPVLPPRLKDGTSLDEVLHQEEGSFEALRLDRIRQARRGTGESIETAGLDAMHAQAYERIREAAEAAARQDPQDRLGVSNRQVQAKADSIVLGFDLSKAAFPAWCGVETAVLAGPNLAWFPLERDRLLRQLDAKTGETQKSISVLLGTALAGHPYAQVYEAQRNRVEALGVTDMQAYARWALTPERITLVLVGDLTMAEAQARLESTFGSFNASNEGSGHRGFAETELTEAPGARRIQASTPGEIRLFMGWRIPPLSHPDHGLLQVIAQMLGGDRNSRLTRDLLDRHLAKSFQIQVGVPGSRESNLLVIEAVPEEGHALAELEQTIMGEVMRLQREPLSEGDIRKAQRKLEADQLLAQEDASRLAQVLGDAQCEGGDWRLAFRAIQWHRDFTQQEVQEAARRYLVPGQATTALLEPDPILMPQDHLESRLVQALARILEPKLNDPAQVESVVRETLRQLRMLPLAEREQTLKLLESQVKP